jgi:hypothetical protein
VAISSITCWQAGKLARKNRQLDELAREASVPHRSQCSRSYAHAESLAEMQHAVAAGAGAHRYQTNHSGHRDASDAPTSANLSTRIGGYIFGATRRSVVVQIDRRDLRQGASGSVDMNTRASRPARGTLRAVSSQRGCLRALRSLHPSLPAVHSWILTRYAGCDGPLASPRVAWGTLAPRAD